MPGRSVIFVICRANMRGIDLYKNTLYEIDENLGKVFIRNDFAVLAEVDWDTKWSGEGTPAEYLAEHPTGKNAMKARQMLALVRGIVMLPYNYKEAPPEPIIMESTPHEKRAKAKKAAEEAGEPEADASTVEDDEQLAES